MDYENELQDSFKHQNLNKQNHQIKNYYIRKAYRKKARNQKSTKTVKTKNIFQYIFCLHFKISFVWPKFVSISAI